MSESEHLTIDHFTVGTPRSANQRGWNEGVEQVWRDEVEPLRRQLARAVAICEAAEEVIAAWDAMDGTEPSRGALMGAFGSLRLALGRQSA